MRSFFAIFALLTLAPVAALKGVRGSKRLLQDKAPIDKMEKKCKKWAPKAVAEPHELKASKGDKEDKVAAKGGAKGDAKAVASKGDAKTTGETKAVANKGDAKAVSDEQGTNTKTTDKGDTKMKGDGGRFLQDSDEEQRAPAPLPKDKGTESQDEKLSREQAEEAECLEWIEDRDDEGSEALVDPSMGSTGTTDTTFDSINADCDDIANDKGPASSADIHSVSFMVNIDVLKDAEATLNDIYEAMEQELQQKVAPRVAGCDNRRFLAESSSTKIVHVDFKELEFDHQGCDSSLAKEASSVDGVCMASDVPVDVYYVGDFPENAIAKVEVAIEEHEWNIDGLLKTSEVAIVQTASSQGSGGEEASPGGMIGGIVAAVVACCAAACGYGAYKRNRDGGAVAKAELETDEESSDDEKQKVAIPEVEARRVR